MIARKIYARTHLKHYKDDFRSVDNDSDEDFDAPGPGAYGKFNQNSCFQ